MGTIAVKKKTELAKLVATKPQRTEEGLALEEYHKQLKLAIENH
jgi:hypothetical protein